MDMKKRPFTVEEGLKVQAKDLARWKTRLNDECYAALAKRVDHENRRRRHKSGYDVFRGNDLSEFVASWRPKSEPDRGDLGWENGWGGKTPQIIADCKAAREAGEKHETYSMKGPWNCTHEYGCRTCGYRYMVDSSG